MNENDSQKMESLLRDKGYVPSKTVGDADVIVVNTCSVREKSYQKAVSEIGRLAKKRESVAGRKPVVAVTGCVVSHDGRALLKRFPFLDIALGPDHIASLPIMVERARSHGKKERVALTDFTDISDYEFPAPLLWNSGETKKATAYVTIMKGCDNTCSFCIVPFVRGVEVSRPADDVIREILQLESQGIREVTLLGQNVNSYGKKLATKIDFAHLLRRIDQETTLARIRFTSPHPKDFSDRLIDEYGRNTKLCPHVHLPVQSGSNSVLKRMRRSYTREVFLRKVVKIRGVVPQIAITTDMIVGFPGETDKDFEETLALVREVGFDASYSFSFSPRPNTEASTFEDDVPPEVKKDRLHQLQSLQTEISLAKNLRKVGRVEDVLVEGPSREGLGQCTGHTPDGRIVNFHGDASKIGAILKVEIMGASPYSLSGKVLCS